VQIVGPANLPTFYDFYCPLLSLPNAFLNSSIPMPYPNGYLAADAQKIQKWNVRLKDFKGAKIGIAWSGNKKHKNDQNRSIALSQLLEWLPNNFQYFSLQNDVRESDRESLNSKKNLKFYGDLINDFSETAALCHHMDIIISVDTSIAHLAGALGKHTFLLLPYTPDWRWLLDKYDSVWYSKMQLFRQSVRGDWSTVLIQIRAEIMKFFTTTQ